MKWEKQEKFSIRKLNVGAASVLIAAGWIFAGQNDIVNANESRVEGIQKSKLETERESKNSQANSYQNNSTETPLGSALNVQNDSTKSPDPIPEGLHTQHTSVFGRGVANAQIKVTFSNGEVLSGTVDSTGHFNIPLSRKLIAREMLQVTQTVPNHATSNPVTVSVGVAYGDIVTLEKPALNQRVPVDNLTDIQPKEVEEIKDLIVQLNPLIERDNIDVARNGTATITFFDGSTAKIPGSELVVEKQTSAKPTTNPVDSDDRKITGTGAPGATVTATVNGQKLTATVQPNGQWEVPLNAPLATGTTVSVTQQAPNQKVSAPETLTVAKSDAEKANDLKAPALAELDKAAAKAKVEIEALPNLSAEEKKAEQAKVDDAAKAAKTKIEQSADATGVTTEVDAGKASIQAVVDGAKAADKANELSKAKADALKSLDKAAEDAKQAIEALPNLSAEEKKAEQAKVDDAAKAAKTKIEQSADATGVTTEVDAGKASIQAVVDGAKAADKANELSKAKADALKSLDKAAEDAKQAIEALPNLSEEEKAVANQVINQIHNQAKQELEQSSNVADVESVVNASKPVFEELVAEAQKSDASKALDKVAEDAKQAIEALPNLSEEEKAVANQVINQIHNQAKQELEQSSNVADVESVVNASKPVFEELVAEAQKSDASKALDKAAEDAKQAIEALSYLSQVDKDKAKVEVDQARDAAKAKVDQATDKAQVPSEVDKGQTAINNLVAAASAKQSAKGAPAIREELPEYQLPSTDEAVKALDQAAEDAKQAIEALPNLSNDEKTVAKQAVDQARVVAKENVSKTATATELAKVTDAGKATIQAVVDGAKATDKVNELAKAKSDAKKALDKAAEDAKKAIDALPYLSQVDKDKAKVEVDQARDAAKAKVDQATDKAQVPSEVDKGQTAINNLVAEASAKQSAKGDPAIREELPEYQLPNTDEAVKALDQAAEDAKKAIDALPNLSNDEKTAAKQAVDQARVVAKENVSKTATVTELAKATDAGKAAIQAVVDGAKATDKANELAKVKSDAKKAIDKAAEDAKKAIDKAAEDAKKAIDKAAEDAKKAIDQSQNLSQADKDKAKAEIDKARDAAKAKVSNSSKIADVTQAVTFARGTNQAIIERVAAIDSANENLRQQNRKDLEKKVVNKLPETGVKENLGFVSLGIIGLILGLAFSLGKREKD